MTSPDDAPPKPAGTSKAGLFDLRWILAMLFTCYGTVLTVLGAAFTSAADREPAGGVNVNLWAGIGMLVLAVLFAAWALWRPIRLPGPDWRPAPGSGPNRGGGQ